MILGRAAAGLSENMRGAVFMMVSMAGFSLNDALIKSVADDLPLYQAVFLRGLAASLLVAGLAMTQGAARFRPRRRDARLVGWRVFAEVGGTVCFLTALFNMPIANATAILQALPLAVTLAAALFLGEPVGWRRYLAIAIGFVGVLIVVRPGAEGFTVYSLWAIGAIGFIVLRDLTTRSLSPAVPSAWVVLVTTLSITTLAGLAAVVQGWRPFHLGHVAVLAGSAAFLLVGYVFGVMTMRTGEIGLTQPFRYTLILWAILFGILFFGEWPDLWMLAGSAIVIATGLYTLQRERRLGLRRPAAAPAPHAAPDARP